MRSAIIITMNEKEVKELHKILEKIFDNSNIFLKKEMRYDAVWYWIYRSGSKDLSGQSGWNSLKHTIATMAPDLPIYDLKRYKDVIAKQSSLKQG